MEMPTFKDRLSGGGLHALAKLTHRTAKYTVLGRDHLHHAQQSGKPLVLATWHGNTMLLAGYFLGSYNLADLAMILPNDWRGGSLGVFVEKMGALPVKMNLKGGNSLQAARQLAKVIRHLKSGKESYITPDGPDGPAFVVKSGMSYLARKSGAWVLPFGAFTPHAYRLHRWDRYALPRPWSKITIDIGAPIEIAPKADLQAADEQITNQLHRSAARAQAAWYE